LHWKQDTFSTYTELDWLGERTNTRDTSGKGVLGKKVLEELRTHFVVLW